MHEAGSPGKQHPFLYYLIYWKAKKYTSTTWHVCSPYHPPITPLAHPALIHPSSPRLWADLPCCPPQLCSTGTVLCSLWLLTSAKAKVAVLWKHSTAKAVAVLWKRVLTSPYLPLQLRPPITTRNSQSTPLINHPIPRKHIQCYFIIF